MRHDWVFDVLTDLMTYARKNDLPALAAQVETAMAVAEAEIQALHDGHPLASNGGLQRSGRAN